MNEEGTDDLKLVASREDTPESLDPPKHALACLPLLVAFPIVGPGRAPGCLRWPPWFQSPVRAPLAGLVPVRGLVHPQPAGGGRPYHRGRQLASRRSGPRLASGPGRAPPALRSAAAPRGSWGANPRAISRALVPRFFERARPAPVPWTLSPWPLRPPPLQNAFLRPAVQPSGARGPGAEGRRQAAPQASLLGHVPEGGENRPRAERHLAAGLGKDRSEALVLGLREFQDGESSPRTGKPESTT